MLESGLLKVGGAKAVSGFLFPVALVVGGVFAWQIWQDKKAIRDLNKKLAATNGLQTQVESLQEQQQQLATQMNTLQTQTSTKPETKATASLNTAPQATQTGSKLSMLKRLVEENVHLRQKFF